MNGFIERRVKHRGSSSNGRRAESFCNQREVDLLDRRRTEPGKRNVSKRRAEMEPDMLLVSAGGPLSKFAESITLLKPVGEIIARTEPWRSVRPNAAGERWVMGERKAKLIGLATGLESPEPLTTFLLGFRVNPSIGNYGEPLASLNNGRRALLGVALALVFSGAPASVVAADPSCTAMRPEMQRGYRALENRQYADADTAFDMSLGAYGICLIVNLGNPAYVPEISYWQAYAHAGRAAAAFGDGKIADGLRHAKDAERIFSDVTSGQGGGEGASASVRRAAGDGLVYVQSLMSAKKHLLPKIWLDWKVAHP